MSESDSQDPEARLRHRLSSEAADDRPAFSDALHERIMKSLQDRPPVTPSSITRGRRASWWLAVAATAAVVAFAVWLRQESGFQPRTNPQLRREAVVTVEPAEPNVVDDLLTVMELPLGDGAMELVDSTFTGPQWAYLDHDVKVATNMVRDYIPFDLPWDDSDDGHVN